MHRISSSLGNKFNSPRKTRNRESNFRVLVFLAKASSGHLPVGASAGHKSDTAPIARIHDEIITLEERPFPPFRVGQQLHRRPPSLSGSRSDYRLKSFKKLTFVYGNYNVRVDRVAAVAMQS